MKKSFAAAITALCLCLSLCGCGIIGNEYVSIKDYNPTVQTKNETDGKKVVKNFAALKQALLEMSYAGDTTGTIVFDAAYDGDTTEDMASACWQVRTQDALCAYCVENIAYELNKIVTINEASVYISYSDFTEKAENIKRISFSYGMDRLISDALRSGTRRLAVLIGRSDYSADDMAAEVTVVYRENPAIVPKAPTASVNMFSGNGTQRLYEIMISYGLSDSELRQRCEQLERFSPFDETDVSGIDAAGRAHLALEYLRDNCTLSDGSDINSAYSALIGREADSEGIAFAYVELCRRLGLDCRIVYGQYAWQEHCWNIVKIDGNYYHVDVSAVMASGSESAFMANDESFWGTYRWDVASYPKCAGTAHFGEANESGEQ